MKKILLIAVMMSVVCLPLMAADFDGDGTGDVAIFRSSSGLWAVRGITRIYFGGSSDNLVPGDYDGSGTDSAAIFRSDSGLWAARGVTRVYFGSGSDEAKPGDYNGDGTYDVGIFRGNSGLWAARGITRVYYGSSGDTAIAPGKADSSGRGTQCQLLETEQNTTYRTGDDGYYDAGVSVDYEFDTISGDQVTIDNNTGLMWASDGSQAGCFWGSQTDWNTAIDYCNGLTFASYSDWRLPNRRELDSLVINLISPAIDSYYFPNTRGFPDARYWTSTSSKANPTNYAWFVDFSSGLLSPSWPKISPAYLRAVRGGL